MKLGTYNKLHLYVQLSETTWCLIGFHGNNSKKSWIFKFSDFVQIFTFVLQNDEKTAITVEIHKIVRIHCEVVSI